jgi:hypothetical protein
MLTILDHKGNEIKTMLRFHLTPVRMTIVKNISNKRCRDVGG